MDWRAGISDRLALSLYSADSPPAETDTAEGLFPKAPPIEK